MLHDSPEHLPRLGCAQALRRTACRWTHVVGRVEPPLQLGVYLHARKSGHLQAPNIHVRDHGAHDSAGLALVRIGIESAPRRLMTNVRVVFPTSLDLGLVSR